MNITFLNAAFLLGALAALLPLIIHLFSRRRVETVDFSSLRFLRELERRKIRRVRVRQILLLIVRSLIILAVAMALARPTLSGAWAARGGHARTSVAIVIDDSASMSRDAAGGAPDRTLFDRASEVALEVSELMDEGDQAFLVSASEPGRSILSGGTFSRGTLSDAVREMEPSARATDYSGAVETALELLAGARNLNRELYVIGDLQRTGWSDRLGTGRNAAGTGDESGAGTGAGVEEEEAEAGGREDVAGAGEDAGDAGDVRSDASSPRAAGPAAYLFPIEGPVGNLGISSISTRRRYGGVGGLYSISVEVHNGGAREAEVPVRLFIDGVQVGRAGVDLAAGERGSTQFSVNVAEQEWHSGWAELPSDALDIDNSRYFAIPPLVRTEIMIVRPDAEDDMSDAYYAQRALDPEGEGERFRIATVAAAELPAQDPERFPVVVLADVGRLSDDASDWIGRYLSAGGGLFVILGSRTDIRYWNSGQIAGSESVRLIEPFERREGLRLAPAGRGHPLLEGLVVGERLIDEIGVTRGFAAEGEGLEDVLEFPGLGPALTVYGGSGEGLAGRVAVLFSGLDQKWNDLPRSGFIVPLFHRMVEQLSGRTASSEGVLVGQDMSSPIPGGASAGMQVTLPDGTVLTPEHQSGRRATAVHREAEAPGIYTFVSGSSVVAFGAANVDPSESDLSVATRAEIERRLGGIRHRFVDPEDDLKARVLESRRGRELWRVFVYLALALLGLEMYLARQRAA